MEFHYHHILFVFHHPGMLKPKLISGWIGKLGHPRILGDSEFLISSMETDSPEDCERNVPPKSRCVSDNAVDLPLPGSPGHCHWSWT